MKKLYTFLSLLLCFGSFTLNLRAEDDVPTKVSLTIYDLTKEAMGSSDTPKAYTDSEGNSASFVATPPTLAANGEIIYLSDVDNPLSCLGEVPSVDPVGPEYTKMILQGYTGKQAARSPYVTISLNESHKFTHVEFSGVGGSGSAQGISETILAFSATGTGINDFGNYQGEVIGFAGGGTCNVEKIAIPEGALYLRLIATQSYGYVNIGLERSNLFYAIRFYVEDTSVGVEENVSSGFAAIQQGRTVRFTADTDVMVYSLTGSLVLRAVNVRDIDLHAYNQGLYIIKAKSKQGENLVKKIVLQ